MSHARAERDVAAEALLVQAMARYREDPARCDFLVNCACAQAPDPLPPLRIAYKFYNRQRRFDLARMFAVRALEEVTARAGLPADFAAWRPAHLRRTDDELASQARLGLKALAFLALRDGDEAGARPYLDTLLMLDPEDGSGASVVEALLQSMA